MKPYLEHIDTAKDGSWTLFDRRLPAIPFEWHYNSEFELTLTLNSRGQRFIGDNISPYGDGDLVLMGPKIPHTWCSNGDICPDMPHQALVLWFSEGFVASLIRPHVELRSIQRLFDHASRALEFSQSISSQARPLICSMLNQTAEDRLPAVLQLLLLLSRDTGAKPITSVAVVAAPSSDQTEERNGRVLAYLNRHYREETNVTRLGQIAALSKSSLHRLFKLQTRMTITEYVTKLRIGNACALLLNTQRPISLIADDVGFQNLAHFNRQFKMWKQQTPRQFRQSFQR